MTELARNPVEVQLVSVNRKGLSVIEIADMICRQKVLIAAWVVFVCGCFIAFVLASKPTYRSQIVFLLMSPHPVPSLSEGSALTGGAGIEVSDAQMATEMQLMQSQETIKQVVEKCRLVRPGPGTYDLRLNRAETRFRKLMTVMPSGKASLITVSYLGSSPEETHQVLTTFASTYLSRQYQIRRAAGSYDFFREQANYFESSWKAAQANLSAFEVRTSVVSLDEQKDLEIRRLNALQSSLWEAEAAKNAAIRKRDLLQQQSTALPQRIVTEQRMLPDQSSAEHLNTEIIDLKNRRTDLLVKFPPTHRLVKSVEEQIAQTESALARASASQSKEEATDINPLRRDLESQVIASDGTSAGLAAQEATLKEQVVQARRELDLLGKTTGEYQKLVNDVKEAESKYHLYSAQTEQARITEEMDRQRVANVVIADPPQMPVTPEPRVGTNAVCGILLALTLVLPLAFVRGVQRPQVFTPWELEGVTGAPVLGTVPDATAMTAVRYQI